MQKKPLNLPIILNPKIQRNSIYLITPASEDELMSGNYIQYGEYRLSNNPKKIGVINMENKE